MSRLTITLSEARCKALKEAAVQRSKCARFARRGARLE
jgi:hypothetical protein